MKPYSSLHNEGRRKKVLLSNPEDLPPSRPDQCSFKTWLFSLTRWRIQDQLRKRHPQYTSIHRRPDETDGTSTIERLPAPETDPATALWDAKWKQDLFARALERLKTQVPEKAFQIFDLYGLQGWAAREVARSLGRRLPSATNSWSASTRGQMATSSISPTKCRAALPSLVSAPISNGSALGTRTPRAGLLAIRRPSQKIVILSAIDRQISTGSQARLRRSRGLPITPEPRATADHASCRQTSR